ncbi:MAG: aminopeptidase N [Betaproteobacteria bacterium RBG_16_66_20]|nr:MAG: aminopeptidase N [Betaproteobacteria bacterium RBG_16_66_20]
MRESQPKTIHLKDYSPPAFIIGHITLEVDIRSDDALVKATLDVRRNPASSAQDAALVLDGDELELLSLLLNKKEKAHQVTAESLTVPDVPAAFTLETVTRIVPQKNTKLEGLYATKSGFVTQCEAQGFRRITWFLDRPDNLAVYTVTVHADKANYPILLCNGNLVSRGLDGDRHWARFEDPFPKPSYLFALVAADLEFIREEIRSTSGKDKTLYIYVEPGKLDQAAWSMDCLKRAIRWDERRFGLELDLDEYKIVAVGDFNSGAMENKGLNIFNTKYVLARPDTATDTDYLNIDRVVAHEYFHNWTGDRVTCRDWFQLSLKEGLTVFRDQEYGADSYSRAVTRIQEVRALRAGQFAEDAGPMAHPVRPQSYMEIRNFYTMTVYEKGAEVVRMQHTLLGEKKFQDGMKLYFRRHDGQAVTCDDFVQAMQDASGVDLSQFRRWYDVAGTPVLDCSGLYRDGEFVLFVRQSMNPPFHIPLAVKIGHHEKVLSVTEKEQSYKFRNLKSRPIPSLLRGFSAPVILNYPYTEADLLQLLANDDDPFNRWEAAQRLAAEIILKKSGKPNEPFLNAIRAILRNTDHAFVAEVLTLPSEAFLAEQMEVVDPDALHASRNALRKAVAANLKQELLDKYRGLESSGPYSPDAASSGKRALRNLALSYLMELETTDLVALCYEQFGQQDETRANMTEQFAALACLANSNASQRAIALDSFYDKWQHEPLIVDKWLAVQAGSRLPGTLARVKQLLAHPAFDLKVPNKVYSLIRGFSANHVRFHAADGAGYVFLADQVLALDKLNPQIAARIARGFDRWKKFDDKRKTVARTQLERIRDSGGLSRDVAEIIEKALA